MTKVQFKNSFWGGFNILCNRLESGRETLNEFSSFIKERISIENQYVKGLEHISKHPVGRHCIGTLRKAFMGLKAETDNLAKAHKDFATILQKEIFDQINKFRDNQKRERKKNISEAQKLTKDWISGRNQLEKFKEKYHRLNSEVLSTEKLIDTAKSGRAASDADIGKMSQKLQKINRDKNSVDVEYRAHVNKMKAFQAEYIDFMVATYDDFQRMEEERITYIQSTLKKFVIAYGATAPYIQEGTKTVASLIDAVSPDEDHALFIQEKGTGNERPPDIEYISFSPLGDNATGTTAETESKIASGTLKMRAIYDYDGQDDTELSFRTDDVCTILAKHDSGWWEAQIGHQRGLIPVTYFEEVA